MPKFRSTRVGTPAVATHLLADPKVHLTPIGSFLRTQQGVHALVPGLTGWAQVNGRDELPIPDKVKLDVDYLQRQSLAFDSRILWLTLVKVLRRDGVSH